MEERNSDHFFHFHFFALRIRLFTIIPHLTKHISYYALEFILCISKEQGFFDIWILSMKV